MAQKLFRRVTHVIFDMDGLLLDTETLYSDAMQTILNDFGKTMTFDVKQQLMGLQTQSVAEFIIRTFELPLTWQEYAERQHDIVIKLLDDVKLMPDTERIYEEITRQIAGEYGRTYPTSVRFQVMGTTVQRTAEITIKGCELPLTVPEFLKKYKKLVLERVNSVPLMPGAERLICHLHDNKVPFALATSSAQDMVEIKTKQYRHLFDLFSHKVCGSSDKEVVNGKPAPDIFLIAAKRFNNPPQPADCLVFEDSPNGVTAGIAADMQVVMVPDPRLSEDRTSHATVVLRSLEDFKPEVFGLPPFSD